MPTEMTRLRKLAGLLEDASMDDAELDELEAAHSREMQVTQYITNTFKRLGIAMADAGVTYAEYPEKSAVVVLDDEPLGFDVAKLNKLYETGMSEQFRVVPNDHYTLKIEFNISDMVYRVLGFV